jgi:hypothetical protein
MIAVLRSELYRTMTVISTWVSMTAALALGFLFSWFSEEFWSLFAGLGAFGVAVVVTGQHYQHRTAVLLYLGQPRRLRALAAQCLSAALIATLLAAISGLNLFSTDDGKQYLTTVSVVPLIAFFGVAMTTVVRKPIWLFAGFAGWLLFVEGMIGRLEGPLPFASFLQAAATGNEKQFVVFAGWTAAALAGAVWAVRRDLTGD